MREPLVKYAGDHRRLICYQKAELIYDITYYFAHRAFGRGDRTVDQMVQAARSGKQNIVEGNAAKATSYETAIKLLNVAKASLQELLVDYEDYLRVNHAVKWDKDSKEAIAMRELAKKQTHATIMQLVESRPEVTVANMAIVLIHQNDLLLYNLIQRIGERFTQEGGFREKMARVRIATRNTKVEE